MNEYPDFESFCDAGVSDIALMIDSKGETWLGWGAEDGEHYAIRPRNEEDPKGPDGDRGRPIGPRIIEGLEFPIRCFTIYDVSGLAEKVARLEKRNSDMGWALNPDRMGR